MGDAALTFDELFDAQFWRAVEAFRLRVGRVARGGGYGEHKSRNRGQGMEFMDFRPYAAGDDLRAVDWNIYRRLGKVFIRIFEEQRNLPLYLLVDVSLSMYAEETPRARAGLQAALALAAVSLHQHDTVTVFPFAEDLQSGFRAGSGRGAVIELARRLVAIGPAARGGVTRVRAAGNESLSLGKAVAASGDTRIAEALTRVGGMPLRPGLLVVISDFFDSRGLERVLHALGRSRHRVVLIQLVRASDAEPQIQGDARLRDCETARTVDITVTDAVLKRYREAYARFNDSLVAFANRRRAALLRLDVEAPVIPQITRLFEPGSRLT